MTGGQTYVLLHPLELSWVFPEFTFYFSHQDEVAWLQRSQRQNFFLSLFVIKQQSKSKKDEDPWAATEKRKKNSGKIGSMTAPEKGNRTFCGRRFFSECDRDKKIGKLFLAFFTGSRFHKSIGFVLIETLRHFVWAGPEHWFLGFQVRVSVM